MNKSFKNHLQTKINQVLRNKKDTEAISDVIESFKVSKNGFSLKRKKDSLKIFRERSKQKVKLFNICLDWK